MRAELGVEVAHEDLAPARSQELHQLLGEQEAPEEPVAQAVQTVPRLDVFSVIHRVDLGQAEQLLEEFFDIADDPREQGGVVVDPLHSHRLGDRLVTRLVDREDVPDEVHSGRRAVRDLRLEPRALDVKLLVGTHDDHLCGEPPNCCDRCRCHHLHSPIGCFLSITE